MERQKRVVNSLILSLRAFPFHSVHKLIELREVFFFSIFFFFYFFFFFFFRDMTNDLPTRQMSWNEPCEWDTNTQNRCHRLYHQSLGKEEGGGGGRGATKEFVLGISRRARYDCHLMCVGMWVGLGCGVADEGKMKILLKVILRSFCGLTELVGSTLERADAMV